MAVTLETILDVADSYEAIVFDQWGVLHNGSTPYPFAIKALAALQQQDSQMAVLSNSGKRADVNRARIAGMGFDGTAFVEVMTSGEALWRDMHSGNLSGLKTLYPVTAATGDADRWAGDLPIGFTNSLDDADAVLLMGLPDVADHAETRETLAAALARGLPLVCSNPDRASPRADGVKVVSPGALAHDYKDAGGDVLFYGKPHPPIFVALQTALGISDPAKILMVGDSPEHDIAGAHAVGWASLFVSGGLHADATDDLFTSIAPPTYTLPTLR